MDMWLSNAIFEKVFVFQNENRYTIGFVVMSSQTKQEKK